LAKRITPALILALSLQLGVLVAPELGGVVDTSDPPGERKTVKIVLSRLLPVSSSALVATIAEAKVGRRGKFTEQPSEENYKSGLAKMKAEDLDGAIDAFLQATYFARNGYYPDAYYWLGVCYMDKREDNKALEALNKCLQQSVEENVDCLIAIAEIHLRNKRWDECEAAVRSIKQYDRKTTQKIQFIYGLMEDKRADSVEAKESTSGFPKGPGWGDKAKEFAQKQSVQAMENERKYHLAKAEGHFLNALGQRPWTWTKAWLYYAESKMKQQKFQEALRELNALLNSNSIGNQLRMPSARMHKDIGFCRLAIGDHQGAIDNWHRALDYNKNDPEPWLQLGMLLESEKHFSSAIKDYKEFLRLLEGSNDPRVSQVRDRVLRIEHMLNPNETAPQRAKPSGYMRYQLDGIMQGENQQQDAQRRQQQQQQQQKGESGF